MGYAMTTLAVAPFWFVGLAVYVRLIHGVTNFSQEWLDAAAIGCVYTLLIGVSAIILVLLVRLVMFIQEQGIR